MSFPSSHREIVCRSWTWRPVPLASKHVLSPPQAIPPACPGVPICQNRSYCNGDFMKVHFDPLEKDYKRKCTRALNRAVTHARTHTRPQNLNRSKVRKS